MAPTEADKTVIGTIVATAVGLYGSLIAWIWRRQVMGVDQVKEALKDKVSQKDRAADREEMSGHLNRLEQAIHSGMKEIRQDIHAVHQRVDRLFERIK